MQINAIIRPNSVLDKAWRGHNRLTGHLGDIVFNKGVGNGPYIAKGLTPAQHAVLKGDPNVIIEILGVAPKAETVKVALKANSKKV